MSNEPRKPSSSKKPYTRPTLTAYGSLKDIVQGSHGGKSDGTPGNTKPCWIAEALYGPRDPRTLLLRSWMTGLYDARRGGWPLVLLYRKFGFAMARAIRERPILRRGFRILFDALMGKALRNLAAVARIAKARP